MVATTASVTEVVVERQSPDGLITGSLTGGKRFRFQVHGGFRLHSDAELGTQLSALTTGLLTEHIERRARHYDALGITLITSPSMAVHERHRRYLREVEGLRVNLLSQHKLLRVRTIGWRKLRYEIADGAVAAVSEKALLTELHTATARLAAEFAKASALKHHAIYGPPPVRAARRR